LPMLRVILLDAGEAPRRSSLIAGARNHLPANMSVDFRFEIREPNRAAAMKTSSSTSVWKWTLSFMPVAKLWIAVTVPVWPPRMPREAASGGDVDALTTSGSL
jgi:hypothetical protein